MTGNGNPPYFAQAMLRHNTPLYGYSYNGIINLDPVIDAIMTLWYRKQDYETDRIFEQLAQQPILPDPYEVASLYYQLFADTNTKINMRTIGRLNEPLTHQVKKAFRTVTITQRKTKIKVKHQNTQQTTALSDENDRDHFIEFRGKIRSYNPHKKVVKSQDYTPLITVSYNSDNGSNHAWMSDLQDKIGDQRLAQIALPGTHDSGMYSCTPYLDPTGISAIICDLRARTQNKDIVQQLNDGIRYFDFRLKEVFHRGCADPTVFKIFHGGLMGPSTGFDSILSSIRSWLNDPRHSQEVLILDLQETWIRYDDYSALVVLLATIQNELGSYIRPIKDLQSTNISYFTNTPRVFVLMQKESLDKINNTYERFLNNPEWLNNRCNFDLQSIKNATQNKIGERNAMLNSHYGERAFAEGLMRDIEDQIYDPNSSANALFMTYRDYQRENKLNVLQIVYRPENSWYIGGLDTLISYARGGNRYFSVAPANNCHNGWLSKRAWMANNASGIQAEHWNKPNILIVDDYDNISWASAYLSPWENKWIMIDVYGYVDFIKNINWIFHQKAMTDTPQSTFSDECLP